MAWNEATETFDLDAAVAEHVERTQREEHRRKEQEAYEAEVSARRGRVEARQRLEAALPAVVRETLRLGEPIYHNGSVEVRLTINDEPWTLWGYDSSTWRVYAPDDVMRHAEDAELLDGLVAAVADYRERSVNRAIAAREEAEKRLRQAEEHHQIEREIEDAKTKAAAALWQWPEDVTLTLFNRHSVTVGYEPVAWVRAMLADDTEPGSAPQPEPEPVGADLPTLTNPAFDLPF